MANAKDGKDFITLNGGEDFTVYQLLTEEGLRYIASEDVEPCIQAIWNSVDKDKALLVFCTDLSKNLLEISSDGTRSAYDSEGVEIDYGSFIWSIKNESSIYDCIIESCIADAISNHSL